MLVYAFTFVFMTCLPTFVRSFVHGVCLFVRSHCMHLPVFACLGRRGFESLIHVGPLMDLVVLWHCLVLLPFLLTCFRWAPCYSRPILGSYDDFFPVRLRSYRPNPAHSTSVLGCARCNEHLYLVVSSRCYSSDSIGWRPNLLEAYQSNVM
jgi:hypothetical protein